MLEIARHKSKRQVEELVARLRPQPPVDNGQLRCRAHNGHEAELYFGRPQPKQE